jgi:hypothetical protein
MQIWAMNQSSSVAEIDLRANVCSVKYSPASEHELAVGSADHSVLLFDTRRCATPLHVFSGVASCTCSLHPSCVEIHELTGLSRSTWWQSLECPEALGWGSVVEVWGRMPAVVSPTGLSLLRTPPTTCPNRKKHVGGQLGLLACVENPEPSMLARRELYCTDCRDVLEHRYPTECFTIVQSIMVYPTL